MIKARLENIKKVVNELIKSAFTKILAGREYQLCFFL